MLVAEAIVALDSLGLNNISDCVIRAVVAEAACWNFLTIGFVARLSKGRACFIKLS